MLFINYPPGALCFIQSRRAGQQTEQQMVATRRANNSFSAKMFGLVALYFSGNAIQLRDLLNLTVWNTKDQVRTGCKCDAAKMKKPSVGWSTKALWGLCNLAGPVSVGDWRLSCGPKPTIDVFRGGGGLENHSSRLATAREVDNLGGCDKQDTHLGWHVEDTPSSSQLSDLQHPSSPENLHLQHILSSWMTGFCRRWMKSWR